MTDKADKDTKDHIFGKKVTHVSVDDLFSMDTFEDVYKKYLDSNVSGILPSTYTLPSNQTSAPSWTVSPNFWNTVVTTDSLKTYHISPRVKKNDCKVEVTMDNGSVEHVTRDELLKYISERKCIQENEIVRKLYERFQVALKLARSDDNGDTGV
jgi:hypothetical protein